MKIVFLDAKTLGDDIDYTQFEQLGEVVKYPFSSSEEVPERAADADVLIVNKVLVNENTVGSARNLKLVCVPLPVRTTLTKTISQNAGSNGAMSRATPQSLWHSIPLPSCST